MRKSLLILALVAMVFNVQAVVKVAYITLQKTMDATATTVQNDPIIQMLNADQNLQVTVKVTASATDVISDLADYDVIIVQEALSGSAGILMPTGSLALKTIPKPFIYNKTYSLKSGRALTTSTAAGGKEATASTLTLTVNASALTNDLFKACTIDASNNIQVFNAGMTDPGATGTKALNYSTGNTITPAATILAQPSAIDAAFPVAICVQDFPIGTTIDSETTISRSIFLGMNFGAICGNAGKNITEDGLTIWRNAVYILGGLTVPTTKAVLPNGINDPKITSSFSFDGKVIRNTNSEVLNVFNVTGKLISTSNKDIDMTNLAKGVYFVKGQNNTLKVSVQ